MLRLSIAAILTLIAFASNSVLNRMAVAGGHISVGDFAIWRVSAGAVVLILISLILRKREVVNILFSSTLSITLLPPNEHDRCRYHGIVTGWHLGVKVFGAKQALATPDLMTSIVAASGCGILAVAFRPWSKRWRSALLTRFT